jgi:Essential protein Yae1, N terminal
VITLIKTKVLCLCAIIVILIFSGCSDQAAIDKAFKQGKEEGYDEGYENGYDEGKAVNEDSGREEGYTEGYDIGYEEGYNVAVEEMDYSSSTYLPDDTTQGTSIPNPEQYPMVGDLTLQSDGMDWSIALDIDKMQFVQDVTDANGDFITFSEAKQIVAMIDAYYENNMKIKTIQEAFDDLSSR